MSDVVFDILGAIGWILVVCMQVKIDRLEHEKFKRECFDD